jgi:hypothetical protein
MDLRSADFCLLEQQWSILLQYYRYLSPQRGVMIMDSKMRPLIPGMRQALDLRSVKPFHNRHPIPDCQVN